MLMDKKEKRKKKLKTSNHKWRNVPMELYPFLSIRMLWPPDFSTKLSKIIPSGQTSSKLMEFSLVK